MPDADPGLFAELKRRNVFRVGAMYAVGAWLVLQIADATFEPLGIPAAAHRILILIAALGFPAALVLGWVFDWTEEGLVRTSDDPQEEVVRLRSSRRIDYAIIGTLALALGLALFGPQFDVADPADLPIRSIAVLPLADPTGDPEQAYFTFGLTEALISELAKVRELRVISRQSTSGYEDTSKSIATIAEELGVEAIVEGSVMRADGRVRISVQLIDAHRDRHLWAESYERDLEDVLRLQAEVAQAIASRIHLEVTPEASRPGRVLPAAHEAYLKGYFFQMKRTRADTIRAVAYFKEAIALDPTSPLGHAGLADEYSCAPTHSWGIPDSEHWESVPRKMIGLARTHAQQALDLDPDSPAGHNSMALVHTFGDWDWRRAEAAYRRTLQLAPGREWAHQTYGLFLATQGRLDDALEHMEIARRIDPLRPDTIMWLASLHMWRDEPEAALSRWQEANEIDPFYPGLQQTVLAGHCGTDLHGPAFEAIEGGMQRYPKDPMVMGDLAYCLAVSGDGARAREVLAAMRDQSPIMYVSPVSQALVHVGLGEIDAAFQLLERGFRDREPQLLYLQLSPTWEPLRGDPRFDALVARIGLPPGA